MKKITILGLSVLFAACSMNNELSDVGTDQASLSESLENLANGYELALKGYTIEDVTMEKDEETPTTTKETKASPWLIKKLQSSMDQTCLAYNSKTRTDARPYGGSTNKVGVFKYGTCGNNREFVFYMDCEDGGNTYTTGNTGDTAADGNVTFHFCLVDPGNYGGGTLLLYDYVWSVAEGDVDVIRRYHDCEDKKNKNEVRDYGGLSSTGLCNFSHNALLYWRFSEKPVTSLPFSYGVLTTRSTPLPTPHMQNYIYIDDENKSNGNEAVLWQHRVLRGGSSNTTTRNFNDNERYRGIQASANTVYEIDYHL